MTIDETNPECVRVRKVHATASFYHKSKRITLVADDSCIRCCFEALDELKTLSDKLRLRR